MFLQPLLRRNPQFVEAAVELHQAGRIPANSCVLDLDAIEVNTAGLCRQARRLGLTVYAMTKQIGRAPGALAAMTAGGVDGYVAVDMACARPIARHGHNLGHLGHLVQVPRAEAAEAAGLEPDYWTIFSPNKAEEAAAAAHRLGRTQRLLVRVFAEGDTFYPGHEGGVALDDLSAVIDRIAGLPGAEFAGLTTFPALLFDSASGGARLTPNAGTLARLPRGAYFINAGRGRHVVEEDLLAALESGQLAGAALDVLREEPPPADSPFWDHPRVTITPHNAADPRPEAVAGALAANIRRALAGTPMLNLVDRDRGY